MNQVKIAVERGYLRAGVVTGLALASFGAFAQVTDPFEDAVTAATTKVEGYGAALVAFSAVAVVFMIAMKYVKKIPRAA